MILKPLYAAVFIFLSACSVAIETPENNSQVQSLPEETRAAIDNYSKQQANVGVLIQIEKNGISYNYATGSANKEPQVKATTDDLFQIGSASKLFTAVSIHQLIEAGKISLSTPIEEIFSDQPQYRSLANFKDKNYWHKITIGMLLNHTSGMIDYLNVYGDDEKALKIYGVRGNQYTADDLVGLAINFGDANFIPGDKFSYSNTGYILLGEIISRISGMPWRDYIRAHIFDVVGMPDTWFGSSIPEAALQRTMTGYFQGEASYMPPTLAGSAGEVVSNLSDMAAFMRFWISAKLYQSPKTLERQLTNGYNSMYENTDILAYGYGVMNLSGYYGHGGQTFGFQSYVAVSRETGDLYIIGANDATANATNLFASLAGISTD